MSDLTLREIARLLEGDSVARGVSFPAPGHGRGDRSARLLLGPQYPDGFHVFSWAGDDWKDLKDYVRDRLGWPRGGSVREYAAATRVEHIDAKCEQRKRNAANLFSEGHYPAGTPVEIYLASRGIRLTEDVAGSVIRFHPQCPWKDNAESPTILVPCMIAAMRNVHDNTITAIHRTRLTPDGRKINRRMLGIAAGSAIKIDADEVVEQRLVIGEGVETCLAARQIGYRPVWALGSAGAIATFPVLSGVETISILAEHDSNGTNERAIATLADRWHDAGREVLAVDSKFGKDINDAIQGVAA